MKPMERGRGGARGGGRGGMLRRRKRRQCVFCLTRKEPNYLDVESLESFINEKRRILPRRVTGTCAVHQRRMTRAVKRARFLGFMPYIPQEV